MKNTQKSNTNSANRAQFRRSALAGACALALGSFAAPGVHAQSATYGLTFPSLVQSVPTFGTAGTTYNDKYIANNQVTTAPVTAPVTNVFTGATFITGPGASPVTVSNNSSTALGVGNIVDPNQIDLVLLQSFGSAGILSGQVRAVGATTATQANITFGVQQTAQAAAPVTVSGNTLAASTTLNQARSIVAGAVPAGYSSTVQGSVAAGYSTGGISSTTAGSVGISSQQTAVSAATQAGSIASITGSKVILDLAATASGAATSPLTLTNNKIVTDFGANAATNTFNASSAGATAFNGSVAVNNAQANIETTGAAAPTSTVTGSSIVADIRNRAAGVTSLSAALAVTGNSLSAASTGNQAENEIEFASGLNVVGSAPVVSNSLTNGSSTLTAAVNATAVLMNGQGNQGTRLESVVNAGTVSVNADNLAAGGSISLNSNAVKASSTGNQAQSEILAVGSTSFAATAAAANSQSNDATPILAINTSGQITVGVGRTGLSLTGPVTASSNTIGATAAGSVATTGVSLTSTNLSALLPSGNSQVLANTAGFGAVSAQSGASANNLQGNYGAATPITASVTGASVAVNAVDQSPVPGARVALLNAQATLDNNRINAQAVGNSAETSVALSAANGSAQAAVGNTQFNGNLINGLISNSGVTLTAGGVSGGSALTLTNSTVSASALANDAVNTVSADAANLTTGNTGVFGVTSDGITAQSNANFGIASGQRNEAAVASSNSSVGSSAAILAGATGVAGIAGSALTANNNRVLSSTTGNRVDNALTLNSTTLETAGNAATQVGSIASLQVNDVSGVANAYAYVGGPSPAITRAGITYQHGLSTAILTANANTVASTSLGNQASNLVKVAAGSLVSSAPAAATGTTSSTGLSSVQNEFGLLNRQSDNVTGGRTAATIHPTVGISNDGALAGGVTASSLTASGNAITAEARNNDAVNSIGLTGFSSLDSGAGLLNQQSSSTNVTADVDNGRLGLRAAGTIADSTFALTENTVSSLAVGSSARNGLNAQADNLSGNASLTASNATATLAGASATADYNLVNDQRQTGSVTALSSTPVRIVLGAATVSGGSLTASGNEVEAIAQATTAANTLAQKGATLTGTTGALASFQGTTGNVSATLAPENGGVGVMTIDAGSTNGTSVALTGNKLLASAGQNEAFNTQSATGTSGLAGKALFTNSFDFSIANAQQGSGAVTATANPRQTGVLLETITGGSIAVTGNSVTSNANSNNSVNALGLNAGSTLAATGLVDNVQNSASAVTSALGSGAVLASVGIAPVTAGNGDYTGSTVSVTGNSLTSRAGSNAAVNELKASGASITGGATSLRFETRNAQATTGAVSASSDIGVIGATVDTAAGTPFSVTGNTVTSAANANRAENSQTLAAVGSLAGSGLVSNTQTSSTGALSAQVSSNAVGVAVGGTGTVNASPVTVSGNLLTADASRNVAINTLKATATTVNGSATAPSFEVVSAQTGSGNVSGANTLGLIGAQAITSSTSSSVTVSGNAAVSTANVNIATNLLALNAINAVTGTARVSNTQTASLGVVSATTGGTGSATPATIGVAAGTLSNSPVTVSGNSLNAQGGGNTALNALETTAVGSIGAGTAPTFAVLNTQNNAASVTTTVRFANMGATASTSFATSSASVQSNSVTASGYGNSASNSVGLSALSANQNQASAAVSNLQANSASVNSVVNGINIGVFGGGASGGASTVTGNAILAQAIGNSASNFIVAK